MAAEECNTWLCLGLGGGEYAAARHERPKGNINNNNNNKHAAARAFTDLSFTLCPKDEDDAGDVDHKLIIGSSLKMGEDDDHEGFGHKSYELNNNYKKNNNNISSRKKLTLTKEQSSFLQDSFKLHTTLNSSQKQALAEQLNLKPRQVEVWFQNKRARTKFKQTEADCEFLKKCCESLNDENKRLKKEIQSMKAGASPLFIQIQKATTCPSCQKIMRINIEGKKWQNSFNATN